MQSDDSDLTELSSDDDYTKSPKKSQTTKKTGYRLRNVLKPGRTTQYTAKALYDQIHDGDIDLDPDYQRDVVWSDIKQIGLIDSIFRNFYVPPIIFAVTTEDDGTEKRTCIDGKQRLTSISKFISGLIPHRDPFTNERLWFVDSKSGTKRKLLPAPYKTLFQNKQIVCIEYSDLPPDFEREVFQRVQMGMALTTAEKMQAISGPWPEFVREISTRYFMGKDGIAGNMDMDRNRARDFQNLAQTLYCIDALPEHVQGTTMQIEKWLAKEDGPSEATRAKIHDIFRIYKDLANHKQLKAPFKKPIRVAPAEFIMTGVLIAMHKEYLSLPQLSQAIGILRTETRVIHDDVRTNGKVFKTMFKVISEKVKLSTLKDTAGQATAGTGSKTGKRKRTGSSSEDNSDEVEYKPRATWTRAPPSQTANRSGPEPAKPAKKAPSPVSSVKVEEPKPAIPPTMPTQASSAVSRPPTGLARIQAAKDHAANMRNGTWPGPQHLPPSNASVHQPPNATIGTSIDLPPSQHTSSSFPHSGFLPSNHVNASFEAAMMHSSAQNAYPPAPYPAPSTHSTPIHPVTQNGSQITIGIPIPANGSDIYQPPPSASRSDFQFHDSYRRNESPRRSKDDRSEGSGYRGSAYRGRRGYDERRGRDTERDYKDKGRDKDKDRDRGRDDSRSRSSYFGHPEGYYKPRDHTWDRKTERNNHESRRGSGYRDR